MTTSIVYNQLHLYTAKRQLEDGTWILELLLQSESELSGEGEWPNEAPTLTLANLEFASKEEPQIEGKDFT